MSEQLDTSGVVTITRFDEGNYLSYPESHYWSGLSPFTQGYIEAMFAGLQDRREANLRPHVSQRGARFSDLVPETLARIIADCETAASILGRVTDADDGAWFWNGGQRQPGFPPLTVTLCDDGKVRFQ